MKKLAVVSFGGSALLLANQRGTIDELEENAYHACTHLINLIERNFNLVITHGNGPQVGNILLANTAGNKLYGLPEMPLDISVAYSQGFIGYILEQQLRNVLMSKDMDRDIISIITQILVNKDDAAFQHPAKPIGPFYTKDEADRLSKETSSKFKEDIRGRGWRKVVASPTPLMIYNRKSIENIAREGHIVIAVGGGGIPCFFVESNKLQGIDAIIDKDIASALLASQIQADKLFIITDVPKVCLNFNSPKETALDKLTIAEAKRYLDEEQFDGDTMAPKIRAAIHFVERSGKEAVITDLAGLLTEDSGTQITIV
ncbi:MAG: carbamate kinase [Bacteroidales bacterium]|nr:carbamate kinase [Bacteroidales bacterium]MDD3700987.1 carbamate kinase [Bacteroidales bacterium]